MFDMESEFSAGGAFIVMGDTILNEAPGVIQPIPEQVELGGSGTGNNTITLGGTIDRPGN